MGDWNGEASWNRDALKRIVVLLFSLANLADLVAGAPYLRRRQVLGILRCGEAEARAFIIGMTSGVPVSVNTLEQANDAAHLAVRLRALALMLCLLLAQGFAPLGAANPCAGRRSHRIAPACRLHAPTPLVSDTS